jgi:hypothetical protein
MHLILSIKQRELKGVSSRKSLNVFKREEYMILFFPPPGWKKRIYGIERSGEESVH